MQTECTPSLFPFESFEKRRVEAAFDGGMMTSDGGALLLREVDRRLAACFQDLRNPDQVEHTVSLNQAGLKGSSNGW